MIKNLSLARPTIINTNLTDKQQQKNSNLARTVKSVSASYNTMQPSSSEKSSEINEPSSTNEPDRDSSPPTEISVYDKALLEPKLAEYWEYLCRGHNPGNAQSMLKVLESRISAENKNGYGDAVRDISALLPALEMLTNELLPLDVLESLTSEQRDAVNKREEVLHGLLHAFSLLLDFLPHKLPSIFEIKRQALKEELVHSALDRLLNELNDRENQQLYEAKIRAIIHTEPYLMTIPLRERLESFLATGLAKLLEPVKQELDKINHTLKSTRSFLSQAPGNAMPPGPNPFPVATTDFRHNVKKCAELLGVLLTSVNQNIQDISTAQKDSARHKKEITYVNNTFREVKNYCHPLKLFDKSTRSLPRSQLISFDKAPATARELCLRLKEMSLPVQDLAVKLQRATTELKNAITHAKSQGTEALPKIDTPENAVLIELQLLTDSNPQTRLIRAMQAARNVALQVQNAPAFLPLQHPAAFTDTEGVFRDFIKEFFATLQSAASKLNQTLQLVKNDLQQKSITVGLNQIIRIAGNIQNDLRYQLEVSTGVLVDSGQELLNQQKNTFLRTLYPVTQITGKGHGQYPVLTHNAEQTRINKDRFCEIHRSILPMLNQVEKVVVANRMLGMALSASGEGNASQSQALNTAIQQCRGLDLNDIRKTGASAVQVSGANDIAVYQRGDIDAKHATTLGKVLKRLSGELLETTERLQIVAGFAAWSADENIQKLRLEVTRVAKWLEVIKTEIKDVVWAATGTRLHNNQPEGMIAKNAGEWLAILRKEWGGKFTSQEIDEQTKKYIEHISKEFAHKDDPSGQLFKTRIMLALKDAEEYGVPWPLTAEAYLGRTKSNKAYIQAWAEKRLTYGILYNLLNHGTVTAMFSVHKSSLVSPLRLLNLLLTPVRMEMTRRAMEKVRPGNQQPSAMIAEYASREKFQAAVRLVSMLSPQLPKTVAAIGITALGLQEGGEYRDQFLKRAVSRLPGDLFWIGGFAAWEAVVHAARKYNIDSSTTDNKINPGMLTMLKKQPEDAHATVGYKHSEVSVTQPNLTSEDALLNEKTTLGGSKHKIAKRSAQTLHNTDQETNPATSEIDASNRTIDIESASTYIILEATQNSIINKPLLANFIKWRKDAETKYQTKHGENYAKTLLLLINNSISDIEKNKKDMPLDLFTEQYNLTLLLWFTLNTKTFPIEDSNNVINTMSRLKTIMTDKHKEAIENIEKAVSDVKKTYNPDISSLHNYIFLKKVYEIQKKILNNYEIHFGQDIFHKLMTCELNKIIKKINEFDEILKSNPSVKSGVSNEEPKVIQLIFASNEFKKYVRNNEAATKLSEQDLITAYLSENKITLPKSDYLATYPNLSNFSSEKIKIIVNENTPGFIVHEIYEMVASGNVPEILNQYIEQRGESADEQKFYDTYHLYKNAISGYSKGMRNNLPRIIYHLRTISAELYATNKSDTSSDQRRETLRVQLFHLKNLCEDIINLEFSSLCVKPVISNGIRTPSYAEETAGRILDSVIPGIQEIPQHKHAVYGPAYQARKSFLAYALYICGINSIDDFNNSEPGKKDASGSRIMSDVEIYNYLLDKVAQFSSNPEFNVLTEIAHHFYYSIGTTTGLTPNPDIQYHVNKNVTRRLREFTSKDMMQSLRYYLTQEIETKDKRVNKGLQNLLKLLAVIDFYSDFKIPKGAKPKVNMRGKFARPKLNTEVNPARPKKIKKNIKGGSVEVIRKPKKINFSSDADYQAAYSKYKENYALRMKDYGLPDSVAREKFATTKITGLDKIKKIETVDTQTGPFIVTSEVDNKGKTLVFSAHGWYSPYSNDLSPGTIPKGKQIIFLGPNKQTLHEADQLFGNSATESLFIPGRYPEIYSRISIDGIERLNKKTSTLSTDTDEVKNYSIKHYEKTPDAEYTAAVKSNRIYSPDNKIDYVRMDPMAGDKKLSDLIKLTKPGQPLSDYDTIVYYACREYKGRGQAVSTLGGGYTITFTDTQLSKQKRSTPDAISTDTVNFDGLYITDKYTILPDKNTGEVTHTQEVVGVILYENDESSE